MMYCVIHISKAGAFQRVPVVFTVAFDTATEKALIKLKSSWHPINNCMAI